MTILADLTRANRQRLLQRVQELNELDTLMRGRGGLADAPEPPALHAMGRDAADGKADR